jgi:hypothetical protein
MSAGTDLTSKKRLQACLLLGMLAPVATANAGTPLLWFGCFWLFVGNWILGLVEARLLERFEGSELSRSRPLMIVANYSSALVGIGLLKLSEPGARWAGVDVVPRAIPFLVAMLLVAYVVTLLVEAPFVALAIGGRLRDLKVWKRNLQVQSITYGALIVITLWLIPVSGVRNWPRNAAVETSSRGWVYYYSHEERAVRRVRLDGSLDEHVRELHEEFSLHHARVNMERDPDNTVARLVFRSSTYGVEPMVLETLGKAEQAPLSRFADGSGFDVDYSPFSYAGAKRFDASDKRRIYTGFWAAEGFVLESRRIVFETPFLFVPWRSATVLPSREIVVQAADTILLLDPGGRSARRLAVGWSPSVLLDPTDSASSGVGTP